jgi:hypothetical protein
MCELACDQTSDWIMVDPWEAIQTEYQPTALVLDHVVQEINDVLGGVAPYEGAPKSEWKRAHVSLLSGSDLLQTMSVRVTPFSLSDDLWPDCVFDSNPAFGLSPTLTTYFRATASSSSNALVPPSTMRSHL